MCTQYKICILYLLNIEEMCCGSVSFCICVLYSLIQSDIQRLMVSSYR